MIRIILIILMLTWSVYSSAQTLTRAEYFFNADPGTGNGTALPVTPAGVLDVNYSIPITSLSAGFHRLTLRFRDNTGKWSHGQARNFFITPPLPVIPQAVNITRAEYFIDTDPGRGNGVSISVSAASSLNQNVSVPLNSLPAGFHNITFRFADDLGKWSHGTSRTFYLTPIIVAPTPGVNIIRAEYFLDTDPGTGMGTPINITAGSPLDNTYALDLGNVSSGFHRLGIRYLDDRNRWSQSTARTFYVMPVVATADTKITQVEYFFDVNPEQNPSATSNKIPVTPTADIDQVFIIDASGLTEGNHDLYVRVKDDKGFFSYPVKETFNILSCTPPPSPTVASQSRCGVGTLTFNATGAAGAQVYRWYATANSTEIIFTGATFETPSLSGDTNYFVSVFDPNTLCESIRTQITAQVTAFSKPVINPSGTLTLCQGNSALLVAPAGFSAYAWSNGETTRQILVNANGTFTVQVGNGACTSESSDPVTVTIVTSAPCSPPPVGNNLPPVITKQPLATQIEGKVEVDLTALISDPDNNIDFTTLRVISNQTSRGAPAFVNASYFLQIDYSGNSFTGADRVTIEVCDLAGACAQQVIDIDVVGAVIVFNGISPDGDGLNDFMEIKYVDVVEGASKNKVSIYNRWGDLVFEVDDYDNTSRVFTGVSSQGKELPAGTYFYKIDFSSGSPLSGFITLKR
jgi:gliding motility-associated-like protein